MAKTFKIGVTNEDREREEAEQLRRLEAEVQEKNIERNKKLEKLNRKSKRNRIIILLVFILLFISFAVFGTYNTFFKQPLTEDDVYSLIARSDNSFNTTGVQAFLYNNLDELLSGYIQPGNNTDQYTIDKNSLRIAGINNYDASNAIVDFYCNINVKNIDKIEKDEKGAEVLVPGEEFYNQYRFQINIARSSYDPNDKKSVKVYEFSSTPRLIESNSRNKDDSVNTFILSPYLSFGEGDTGIQKVSDETNEKVRIKVERIISDLYEGKDVSGDFTPSLIFETSDKFLGLLEFQMYQGNNGAGCNAVCEYQVQRTDGLVYSNTTYLCIEENGNSYKITKFL